MGHSVSTEMFAGALHVQSCWQANTLFGSFQWVGVGTDSLSTPERLLQANI